MKPDFLIIGLGNPGAGYARSRHNVGFAAVDALAKGAEAGEWRDSDKFQAATVEATIGKRSVLLMKPKTYMNLSGQAAVKATTFYKLPPSRVLVLCDDIDLPLGTVRFRQSGGPGTHNGLKSLVECLGEDFARIRIGIGTPTDGTDLAAWVLSVPPVAEEAVLKQAYEKTPALVQEFLLKTV